MNKKIVKTANEYQALAREAKELDAKIKPLKEAILEYADENRNEFDESFQIKFPNGAYVQLRVRDVIEGNDEALKALAENLQEQFLLTKIDEKKLVEAAKKNRSIQKSITSFGASIGQKETMAVFAG